MKTKSFGLIALLVIGSLTLTGCNDTENPDENLGMANPASVYCEENGGTLIPAEDEEWNQYAFCQIDEDTICEEWEYYRGECPVEVNSDDEINSDEIDEEEIIDENTAENSEEDVVEEDVVDENVNEEVEIEAEAE